MKIADLLSPDRVVAGLIISSKKRLLEHVSEMIARDCPELSADEIFEGLFARERLGSTGLGEGVAIPHGRIKGARKVMGGFVQLHKPIDYDAMDKRPVDLLFCLVVPEASTEEHLQVLAALAELFSNKGLCQQLREAKDSSSLYRLLTQA
ncbi:MAG: PTS IIA-like nitrogen-regulatory protein PtsN [Gammaproteobacteria bacterium RBG_16_57_12]|nr:MAG: PTS IIA-like nitrogen-regulatory protein PtsN [Gammaproteobacteria bacterium RBG_16_57_12]